MKPIEIHIEGYKIVISEDEQPEITEEKESEKITYIPYPINPTVPPNPDWWRYPYVTWKAPDVTVTNTTDYKAKFTPVRDAMVGKEKTE